MDFKKFFPVSANSDTTNGLVTAIIIYVVAIVVSTLLMSVRGGIAVIGTIIGIVGYIFYLYCSIGIIISLLIYFKVIK